MTFNFIFLKIASFLENNEVAIEEWWIKNRTEFPSLYQYLCVKTLQHCCPKGTWGHNCLPCLYQKNSDVPCSGNGYCKGDATRIGDGTCKCNFNSFGTLCDRCVRGYFLVNTNSTHSKCAKCDDSCNNTCTGFGPGKCDKCSNGFVTDPNNVCLDIDECQNDNICKPDEFCSNLYGSYKCSTCHSSCHSCIISANNCTLCNQGYRFSLNNSLSSSLDSLNPVDIGECQDIDECEEGIHDCFPTQTCNNTAGSYECKESDLNDHQEPVDGWCFKKTNWCI
ncbi:unnamed protein product [Gordionus sp. m RMFG-2023]